MQTNRNVTSRSPAGISREVYRIAVQCGDDIPWQCERCATFVELPNFESTRNDGIYKLLFEGLGRGLN